VTSTDRVAVSRTMDASAARVFSVVTDPNGHVQIDGSGMLTAAPDAKRLEAVGDTFDMDMDREPLGDIPMGKYQVRNTVTKIVPDTLLEWNVGGAGRPPLGHVYGWEITPLGDERSEVTNYCDWSQLDLAGIPEQFRDTIKFPVVPVAMMEQSVEKLAKLVSPA
jgi:uncharacterized protein YndB with AHSA1/START domain